MKRGFTLLELVVAATLFGLLGTLAALLLSRTLRATLRGSLRVDMQEQALLALDRLAHDLRRTSPEGVGLRSGADPRCVAIHPLSDPALRPGEPGPVRSDGSLRWAGFYLLYLWDRSSGALLRREWPPGGATPSDEELDATSAHRLSGLRLLDVLNGGGGRELTMASGVTDFSVTSPLGGSDEVLVQPLSFSLTLQRSGNTGRGPEVLTFRRSAFLLEQR